MTHIPLAADPLDRAAHRRLDEDWLDAAFRKDDALIMVFRSGAPFVDGDGALVWLGPQAAALTTAPLRIFLGLDRQGAAIFALDLPDDFDLDQAPISGLGDFEDARGAFSRMAPLEANLASTARSIFEWHRSHGFCARCGAPSDVEEAGWKRHCPNCGAEHFPRTDPVAIMLAVKDDRCLLGRQANWPQGFYSCLAGFVEPGETPEQAAARELEEEAGIQADPARAEYLFSQPWPFPSSLMVGLILEAETEEIRIDQTEIEEARWFSREEAAQIIAGQHPSLYAPPEIAVAHHILKVWVERGA
ncbi:MAG: NAD(+) diphosphatase [Pseudomonadota bacterium]